VLRKRDPDTLRVRDDQGQRPIARTQSQKRTLHTSLTESLRFDK
jgi:hypothetical protein